MTEHTLSAGAVLLGRFRVVILAWWIFWLAAALLTHGGLSHLTTALVLISVFSFFLGTLPFRQPQPSLRDSYFSPGTSRPHGRFAVLLLVGLVLYQLNTCVALYRSGALTLGAQYRAAFFSGELMGSGITYVLYEFLAIPLATYGLFYLATTRPRLPVLLSLTIAFFLTDAFLKLGRFPLYHLLFMLFAFHTLGIIQIRLGHMLLLTVAVLAMSYAALTLRSGFLTDLNYAALSDLAVATIFNYHIVGFYILDNFIGPGGFPTEIAVVPRYTLGFCDYVLSLIARRAGFDFTYPQQALNIALTAPMDIPGLGIYNGFGTNLLPYYLDGGILFCAAVHYCLGRFLMTLCIKNTSHSLAMAYVVASVMFFGIFQSRSSSADFYVSLTMYLAIVLAARAASPARRQLLVQR